MQDLASAIGLPIRDRAKLVVGNDFGGFMDCFFCSDEGTHAVAVGVCVDCGCAACGHHGAVETVRLWVRTGNMFEQRPTEARRFRCAVCRMLNAPQNGGRIKTARTGLAAG